MEKGNGLYSKSHTLKGLCALSDVPSALLYFEGSTLKEGRKFRLKNKNKKISKTSKLSVSAENCFYAANQITLYRKYTYFKGTFELK